ncbi:MAG TPA: hypothetical protein VFE51_08490 [Verrucomicrobiae bacterium]|nr:hypothetical protein [Verrucomicrobiae bacterium]
MYADVDELFQSSVDFIIGEMKNLHNLELMTSLNWTAIWFCAGLVGIVLAVLSSGTAWAHRRFQHPLLSKLPGWFRDVDLFTCICGLIGAASMVGSYYCASQSEKAKDALIASKISPRHLSKEQRAKLLAGLKEGSNKVKGRIIVQAGLFDPESMDFACEINEVLTNAGLRVHFPRALEGDASLSIGPPGLHIAIKDISNPPPGAGYMQHCFMNAGLEAPGLTYSEPIEPSDIVVVVGQR